jgi:hypothetical protein
MKKLMVIAALMTLAAGKGPAGSKGDPGSTGLPGRQGPGAFVFLSGNVTSNDFTVTDSRISQADQISVYLGDGTNAAQLPYFLPALGYNTFYLFRQNQVEIFKAVDAGATRYTIEIITQ